MESGGRVRWGGGNGGGGNGGGGSIDPLPHLCKRPANSPPTPPTSRLHVHQLPVPAIFGLGMSPTYV